MAFFWDECDETLLSGEKETVALDDAFKESIDTALKNRVQMDAMTKSSSSSVDPNAASPLPSSSAEWIAISLMWLVAFAVFLVLSRTSRYQWGSILKWTRLALLAWMTLSMFASLISIRHGDSVYTTWLLLSSWPAPIGLIALWIGRIVIVRRLPARFPSISKK